MGNFVDNKLVYFCFVSKGQNLKAYLYSLFRLKCMVHHTTDKTDRLRYTHYSGQNSCISYNAGVFKNVTQGILTIPGRMPVYITMQGYSKMWAKVYSLFLAAFILIIQHCSVKNIFPTHTPGKGCPTDSTIMLSNAVKHFSS